MSNDSNYFVVIYFALANIIYGYMNESLDRTADFLVSDAVKKALSFWMSLDSWQFVSRHVVFTVCF